MVYQSCVQGLTLREIASNLNVDHSTVCRVLKIFEETGNVEAGKSSGRPKALNVYDEFIIIENVIENPKGRLEDNYRKGGGCEYHMQVFAQEWVFTAKTSSSAMQPRTRPKVYD